MKIIHILQKIKWPLIVMLVLTSGLYYYFSRSADNDAATASFYVVDTVSRGEVTSGIETTGNIIAAQKLDIDVYKQLSRIDAVNVQNGSHVEAGDVLISFDKSDAYVDTQSAKVSVAEAALALSEEKAAATDPSTAIRTKENQIAGYKKAIADVANDIAEAYRDFLNEDLETMPHKDAAAEQNERTEPSISGRYVSEEQGQYVIELYSSGADSGYSYKISGLESATTPVIFGKSTPLGTRGLEISFPNDTRSGDKWVVLVPNTAIATYEETKSDYEQAVRDLEKSGADAQVNLDNATQELAELKRSDTTDYRNLSVEKAETTLAEARERLAQNYDVVQERNIVAPFSGTVEGMSNVVVGATPTGGSEDSISLGTLISDEFLTTFSLGATDVAKVEVGQLVKVTITSFAEQPVFEAHITQISSLPDSEGVAQYEVQALLEYDRTSAALVLREGMLADIEVVEEKSDNALRLPTSAISYQQGAPTVSVVDSLTAEEKLQVERMGIIRTDGTPLVTYSATIELGIVGQYYVEVVGGLDEGDLVVTSSLAEAANTSVVEQAGFGPPGGGQRPSGGTAQPPND